MSPKTRIFQYGPPRHITYLNLLEPVSGQRMKPEWINPYTGLILHLPLTGVAALPSSTIVATVDIPTFVFIWAIVRREPGGTEVRTS